MKAVEMNIGSKIKKVRLGRKITLEELASRTGFTKSYLSKIETKNSSQPIGTLFRISKGLEVDISNFFPYAKADVSSAVVKKGKSKTIASRGTPYGYSYESLAFKMRSKKMEPFLVEFPPNTGEITLFQHEGEEVMYVLEGKMVFIHEDNKYILEEGDCIYFQSDFPHGGQSYTNNSTKVFVVIYKP